MAALEALLAYRRAVAAVGALLLGLAAWLLLPRPAASEVREPAVRALLVDASASVVRRRPGWLPWIRAELARQAQLAVEDEGGAAQQLAVVVFGADVAVRFGPGAPAELIARLEARAGAPFDTAAEDDGASALAGALEVAAGWTAAATRPPGEVILLGDGGWTGANPAPWLGRLAAAGVAVRHAPPPPATRPDGAVLSVDLPEVVEVGAPLVATARVRVDGPLVAPEGTGPVLLCEVSGGGGTRTDVVPLALGPGETERRVPIALGPADYGRTEVAVRIALPGGVDPVPENDRAAASTVAEGELVCGAVAAVASREALERWLAPAGAALFPGLQVLLLRPDELAGKLDQLDLLVTYDVPLDDLPAPLLAPFVERGGGWLAVSGWGFLGDWSPGPGGRSELHRMLPMRPAPTDVGPRDVVLLVDGSGSMAGEPFNLVRAAAVEMVAAALPSDAIELRFFTEVIDERHLLRKRSALRSASRAETREAAAQRLLGARVPGGSTWILSCLDQLLTEREGKEREALVLLLTDGQEGGHMPDPAAKAAELVERYRAARTRLRVIAVGEQADLGFLGRLVAPGEEVVQAADLADLELIFQREVNRARVADAETEAGLAVRRAPASADSLAAELLAPEGALALPPIERLVRNELVGGASLLWETADGDPLLAVARAGLGRTALFASSPRASWASRWSLGAERFGAVLRWLGRGRARGGPRASLAPARGGGLEVRLERLAGPWPATVSAALFDPEVRRGAEGLRAPIELDLAPAHPGDPGLSRRVGALPRTLREAAAGRTLSLLLDVPAGAPLPAGPLALPLAVPPAPEFVAEPGGTAPGLNGGAEPETEAAAAPRAATAGAPGPGHPAGPPLAGLGLALLFLGGTARRLAEAVQGRGPSGR
ncbi:MAG: VWA domain-containing protein [Planctomycetota bacterium]